jgi:magnesium-transporting ATPase (P-type)
MTVGTGPQRTLPIGTGSTVGSNNAIYTSKYNIFNFLPISVREQFRRNGNLYFLVMGALMFVGTYTPIFESSVSPWTTLGPLAVVVAISLAQEGAADAKRHRSDRQTNNHRCVVLRRADRLEEKAERDENIMDGNDIEVELKSESSGPKFTRKSINTIEDGQNLNVHPKVVKVAFLSIRRMDMRAGDIVLVKNREMVPADIILLGSSGENGAAYIETSPIDGETNLKLRSVPQLPIEITEASTPRNLGKSGKSLQSGKQAPPVRHPKFETIERAVKRVTRISLLGFPEGVGASLNPNNPGYMQDTFVPSPPKRQSFPSLRSPASDVNASAIIDDNTTFVTSITSEAPNASVNTFSGKITLPPLQGKIASTDIPLGAENILLRGAVLRNTEWAIGVACFTGADTKLARNSIKTPSKFSKLDVLMNRTVVVILFIMLVCVVGLSVLADAEHKRRFDEMWYASYNTVRIPSPIERETS